MSRRELVEAGAGCGKTYSIVTRYIEALGYDAQGTPLKGVTPMAPSEIVCLTFTELAAAQMLERVLDRLESLKLAHLKTQVIEECRISTFHGFCYKCLNPYLTDLGYSHTEILPSSLTRLKRKDWLLRRFESLPSKVFETLRLNELLNLALDQWFQAPALDPKRLAEKLFEFKSAYHQTLAEARAQLENACHSIAFSFNDNPDAWPTQAYQAFRQSPVNLSHLKFQKTGKPSLKKTHPEVQELFMKLRDLHQEGLHELLEDRALERELSAQREIFDYLREVLRAPPKILDFAALEHEFLALLRSPKERSHFRTPKLFIVDEFQDTSPEQFEIVSLLSAPSTEWYFVGDPKQSIYSFRKADIRLYQNLKSQLTLVPLQTNWRSHPRLLDLFNQLQEILFDARSPLDPPAQRLDPSPKSLEAPSTSEASMRVYEHSRGETLFDSFCYAFKKRMAENNTRSHAVLFRSWNKLYHFAQHLEEHGLAYRIIGSENFLDHHLSDLFLLYLHWADSSELKEPPLALQRWILNSYQETIVNPELLPPGQNSPTGHLLRFSSLLQPHRWLGGSEWAASMERKLIELEKLRFPLQASARDLAFFLKESLRFDETKLDGLLNRSPDQTETLNLMTVHASKGLEFDCVYLMESLEHLRTSLDASISDDEESTARIEFYNPQKRNYLPSLLYRAKSYEKALLDHAESKRVFYVAFTRAKETVDVFIHRPSDRATRVLESPLQVLGLAGGTKAPWNLVLQELNAQRPSGFEWLKVKPKSDEQESMEALEDESSPGDSSWLVPRALNPRKDMVPFRGGVSEFLHRESRAQTKRIPSAATTIMGTSLHEALSVWDGLETSIEALPHVKSFPQFSNIFSNLLKISELKPLWQSLQQPEAAVRREMPLLIHKSRTYTLSGVADLVALIDNELWILDWKSSGSLQALQSPERIQQIREQLQVYAQAFSQYPLQCRLLAVGIDLTTSHSKLLLNELQKPTR